MAFTLVRDILGATWRDIMTQAARRSGTGARSSIGARLRAQVFDRDGHRCHHCGTTDRLVVDHIVPVVRGGSSDLINLQTLCAACNGAKGSSEPTSADLGLWSDSR